MVPDNDRHKRRTGTWSPEIHVFWIAFFLVCVPYILTAVLVARDHLCIVTLPDRLGMLVVDIQVVWMFVGGGIATLLALADWGLSVWKCKRHLFSRIACRSFVVIFMAIVAFPAIYVGHFVFRAPVHNVHDAIRLHRTVELENYLRKDPTLVHKHFESGETLLHHKYLSSCTAKVLISRGAEVNARDYLGCTPLHHAASADNPVLIQTLISEGAVVDVTSDDGSTPLHVAAELCPANVAVLLEEGAIPDLKNNRGQTPLDIAETHVETVDGSLRRSFAHAIHLLRTQCPERK